MARDEVEKARKDQILEVLEVLLSKGSLIPYPTGTMEHLKGFHQRKGRDVDKTRLTF